DVMRHRLFREPARETVVLVEIAVFHLDEAVSCGKDAGFHAAWLISCGVAAPDIEVAVFPDGHAARDEFAVVEYLLGTVEPVRSPVAAPGPDGAVGPQSGERAEAAGDHDDVFHDLDGVRRAVVIKT